MSLQRQMRREDKQEEGRQGEQAGEPADVIGQVHDPQVVVGDVGHLVGQHTGQLARRQAEERAVAERNGRSAAAAPQRKLLTTALGT